MAKKRREKPAARSAGRKTQPRFPGLVTAAKLAKCSADDANEPDAKRERS